MKTPFSEPEWQDPEFVRKVRGLEGMLRVRKSLERAGGCASGLGAAETDSGSQQIKPVSGTNSRGVGISSASIARRVAGKTAAENDSEGPQVQLSSGSCASSACRSAGWVAASNDSEQDCNHEVRALSIPGEKGIIGLREVNESDRFGKVAATAAASAGESEGIIRLLEVSESEFPPLPNSSHAHNSCLRLSTSACARASCFAGACAGAAARVCPVSSSSAISAVVHAHATTLHSAQNSWSDTARSQGPTARRCTKGGVSGSAEDLRPVPEVEAGVNFRPAGRVRGHVAGSLPGRQPGTGTRTSKGSVVTPSLHPEVPDSLFVSPGPGKRIRQLMGWTKVCGTTQSGIWVLKGNARTCMFPANLDYLRVGWWKQGSYKTARVTPGHDCLCAYKYGHGAAVRPQTNKAIWDGYFGVIRRNCQRG